MNDTDQTASASEAFNNRTAHDVEQARKQHAAARAAAARAIRKRSKRSKRRHNRGNY